MNIAPELTHSFFFLSFSDVLNPGHQNKVVSLLIKSSKTQESEPPSTPMKAAAKLYRSSVYGENQMSITQSVRRRQCVLAGCDQAHVQIPALLQNP